MASKRIPGETKEEAKHRRALQRRRDKAAVKQKVEGVRVDGTRGLKAGTNKNPQRFLPGQPGGPGRPKGSLDRKTILTKEMEQQLAERAEQGIPITPLEYFLKTLTDPMTTKRDKQWAASAAAPYLHRKMPIAIEGGDQKRPVLFATMEQLAKLNNDELETLYSVLDRISPDEGGQAGTTITRTIEGEAGRIDSTPEEE